MSGKLILSVRCLAQRRTTSSRPRGERHGLSVTCHLPTERACYLFSPERLRVKRTFGTFALFLLLVYLPLHLFPLALSDCLVHALLLRISSSDAQAFCAASLCTCVCPVAADVPASRKTHCMHRACRSRKCIRRRAQCPLSASEALRSHELCQSKFFGNIWAKASVKGGAGGFLGAHD